MNKTERPLDELSADELIQALVEQEISRQELRANDEARRRLLREVTRRNLERRQEAFR